jgi:hypothetical protein
MMRNRYLTSRALPLCAALAALTLVPAPTSADDKTDGETFKLFNGKDLSGWSIFVDPNAKKYSPESSDQGIFTVKDGVIHVTGERFAALTTEKEYDNYRLVVEFKWGEKRWPPRENAVRDSGILMHAVGPEKIWARSIECQIQEHDCGDFYLVGGTSIVVNGKVETGRVVKSRDGEKPTGQWNTVEVICDGDSITNIVNGVTTNHGTKASVTRGKIVLQSEGAEIFFRKVELTPLKK